MSLIFDLYQKVLVDYKNNHLNNWDSFRFGPEPPPEKKTIKQRIKEILYGNEYLHIAEINHVKQLIKSAFSSTENELEKVYSLLADATSKSLYIELLAFRLLGHRKVLLSTNNAERKKYEQFVKSKIDYEDCLNSNFNTKSLFKSTWKHYNHDVSVYLTERGLLNASFLKQYECITDNGLIITYESDDIIVDCGGCWGDTTIEFSNKTGVNGKVYVFEFVPYNLNILRKNLALNPHFTANTEIIENPCWDLDDIPVYIVDEGPGSRVLFHKIPGAIKTQTKTIDSVIDEKNICKVDFIKMDIEGAELNALKGAKNTISKFKPKLAISIYHSPADLYEIALWINGLKIGYKFWIRHFSIHAEETVLFACV